MTEITTSINGANAETMGVLVSRSNASTEQIGVAIQWLVCCSRLPHIGFAQCIARADQWS